MAVPNKILGIYNLFKQFSSRDSLKWATLRPVLISNRAISTSNPQRGLMEFFDDKTNWGANEIKCGRSWRKEELRLKSNSDLHKLWFILLKERNMLLTMEEEANERVQVFPSPERLDKVAESMENLEEVVRERNRAYHELETGETGERPGKLATNIFGLNYFYKMSEHVIPKYMNKTWRKKYQFFKHDPDVEAFLVKLRERLYLNKRRKHTRDFNHVIGLLNRFPNMDMEALKQQYPDVDIERAKRSRKYGGHFEPK
ncbi:hypothetical protein ABEB36_008164 [Hypothenemus hampei]|uniref:Large ribosomal subunit protein uL29m n=1 Tax=Hypothenemus hampei TaxID=57062 RepID=A0ABD1EKY4_HYPHA